MSRQIFRPAALAHYNDRIQRTVLPRFASPPWTILIYALGGLMLALIALLWTAQTPVYVNGPGVVVQGPAAGHIFVPAVATRSPRYPGVVTKRPVNSLPQREAAIAVFMSPGYASSISPGQPAIVHWPEKATDEQAAVMQVDREVVSPGTARARYDLDASAGLLVDGPVVVTLIRSDRLTKTMVGSVCEVHVLIGSQRALALLPWIGRFFAADSHAAR